MRPDAIHWGIIGAGKIAHKFAKDLKQCQDCEVMAIASRSLERAQHFARQHHISKVYGSYDALVQDPNIDAVYIATPHSFHKAHTLLALSNRKAVLCEKPLAMNATEVEEMMASAQKQDVLLMEALWTAFLPHFQFVKEQLAQNIYGKIQRLEADFGFYTPFNEASRVFDKSVGGGSLLDIGIYPVFAALSILGVPEKVKAAAEFFKNGADASCTMHLQYDQAEARLKSTLLEETKTEATFFCENGTIRINSRFHEPSTVTLIDKHGDEEIRDFGYDCIGYKYEIEHFNTLLRAGKTESPIMTFEMSKNLISILDQLRSKINLEYKTQKRDG